LDLQLSEIKIKNLLSYKNAEFTKLKNFNVLIGKNNAGKSNLFKLLGIIQQNLHDTKLKPGLLFNNNPELQGQISLTFKFSNEYLRNLLLDLHSRNKFLEILKTTIKLPEFDENEIINYIIDNKYYHSVKITLLYLSSYPDILILQGFHFIHKEEKLQCVYQVKQEEGKISIYLLSQPIKHLEGSITIEEFIEYGKCDRVDQDYPKTTLGNIFRNNHYNNIYLATILPKILSLFRESFFIIPDSRYFPKSQETSNADVENLKEDGSNFARFIFKQENNEKMWMQQLNTNLKEFIPDLQSLSQKFKSNQTELYYKEKGLFLNIEKDKMGSGILHVAFFFSFLKEIKEDSIILIEEPELFLFPGLQKMILEKLLNISEEIQIFITTHSPFFLSRKLSKCSIHQIKKINNSSIVKNIGSDEIVDILTDLGLGLYDYILYDGILFVEGLKDIEVFSNIIELFFKESIKIISIEGKENFKHYANAEILLFLSNNDMNFLFLLDKDRGNQEFYKRIIDEDLREIVKERIITLFIYELENIFLQPILIIDYIFIAKPNVNLKELSSFVYQNIQNQFKTNGLNNYEYVLKSFNDTYFPRLKRDEIKKVLKESEKASCLADIIKIWIDQITQISRIKLEYFSEPSLDADRIKEKMDEIFEQYNDLFEKKEFNKIISGKKVFKKIRADLSDKFRLGKFTLEDLSKHLILLIDDYIDFRKDILSRPGNQGTFKEVASISNVKSEEFIYLKDEEIGIFKNFCENCINLIQNLKSKLILHFKNTEGYKGVDFSILKHFFIQRWKLGKIF